MMKVTVAKWRNSLAVRLPRSVAADLGFGPGTQLDLFVADRGNPPAPARKVIGRSAP